MAGGKNYDFDRYRERDKRRDGDVGRGGRYASFGPYGKPGEAAAAPTVNRLERGIDDADVVDWAAGVVGTRTKWRDSGHRVERGLHRMVREEREARPWERQRSAYLNLVGENPDVDMHDHKAAITKIWLIKKALVRGGWTKAENARLHKMLIKWTLRAEGRDPRFRVAGNAKGRRWGELTEADRADIAIHQAVASVLRLGEKKRERSES